MSDEPIQTLKLHVPVKLHEKIRSAVERGAYASEGEVVRHALMLWEEQQVLAALEVQRLKAAYEEGLASGEPLDGETVMAELEDWLEKQDDLRGSRIAAE